MPSEPERDHVKDHACGPCETKTCFHLYPLVNWHKYIIYIGHVPHHFTRRSIDISPAQIVKLCLFYRASNDVFVIGNTNLLLCSFDQSHIIAHLGPNLCGLFKSVGVWGYVTFQLASYWDWIHFHTVQHNFFLRYMRTTSVRTGGGHIIFFFLTISGFLRLWHNFVTL